MKKFQVTIIAKYDPNRIADAEIHSDFDYKPVPIDVRKWVMDLANANVPGWYDCQTKEG